jgi:ABC-type nitrate/sulfonate/bicarbonate transport system substrate-binding protein
MIQTLRIGYMPLTDAGLLFVAAAKGFDREEGLVMELCPETSWANLRDKLALGIYDAAHMLAPAVIASALGLDGFAAPMIGAVALGLDGNAISVAPALGAALRETLDGDSGDPAATARALAALVADRRGRGLTALRFAHVFPWSMHHCQLKLWMGLGGVDAEGVRLTVTPPPLMEESLRGGFVNGFCVGEPWNTLAQNSGAAEILHPCRALMQDCPEKVLAFRAADARAAPEPARAAARAVRRAARWGENPENADEFAGLIAEGLGGGVTAKMVAAVLGRDGRSAPWLRLDAEATALSPAQALWVFALIAACGLADASGAQAELAQKAFWPLDGVAPPPKAPAFFDGPFDPARWREALAGLMRRPS